MGDNYQNSARQNEQKVLLMFGSVLKALQAEKVLKAAHISCELLVPPVELRTGCDLAVALEDLDAPAAYQALEEAAMVITDQCQNAQGTADLSDVVTSQEFCGSDGKCYVMARAGNMKMTVEKDTGLIVNTSGGGCPDIPYLNVELVGKTLFEAPHPRTLGKTLCGLMLERAFYEACAQCGVIRHDNEEANSCSS